MLKRLASIHHILLIATMPLVPLTLFAEDKASSRAKAPDASKEATHRCPIEGNPAKPSIATTYEDKRYAFCSEDCLNAFVKARETSLYHQVGGKKAISAVIDHFYVKVMADDRVNHHFEDVNMRRQQNRQKAFVGAALGGPEPWTGKDMRKAHKHLSLTEEDFSIIATHLQAAMTEKGVSKEQVGKIMAVVATTKDAVLNRPVKENSDQASKVE